MGAGRFAADPAQVRCGRPGEQPASLWRAPASQRSRCGVHAAQEVGLGDPEAAQQDGLGRGGAHGSDHWRVGQQEDGPARAWWPRARAKKRNPPPSSRARPARSRSSPSQSRCCPSRWPPRHCWQRRAAGWCTTPPLPPAWFASLSRGESSPLCEPLPVASRRRIGTVLTGSPPSAPQAVYGLSVGGMVYCVIRTPPALLFNPAVRAARPYLPAVGPRARCLRSHAPCAGQELAQARGLVLWWRRPAHRGGRGGGRRLCVPRARARTLQRRGDCACDPARIAHALAVCAQTSPSPHARCS